MTFKDLKKKHFSLDIIELIPKISNYKFSIFSKNRENIEWLSSHLTGVHQIRFTDDDRDDLFYIIGVDKKELQRDIYNTKGFRREWRVSSNAFNVACMMLVLLALESKLSVDKQNEVIEEIMLVFNFRFATADYAKYYKYTITEDLAKQVFNRMTYKYDIKRLGSNFAVLQDRCKHYFNGTKHAKKLLKNNSQDFIDTVNNVSRGIRNFVANPFNLLLQILEEEYIPSTISVHVSDSESDRLEIIQSEIVDYYNLGHHLILNPDEMLNKDIMVLASEIIPGTKIDFIERIIRGISKRALVEPKPVFEMVDNIISGTIDYLFKSNHYPPYDETFTTLLQFIKSYWSNAKVKNENNTKVKETMRDIIIRDTGLTNINVVRRYTILVIIYIFSRVTLDRRIR